MSDVDGRSALVRRAGIDGILSAANTSSRAANQDMSSALRDLHTLMGQAKKMVQLAETLNAKLLKQEAAAAANKTLGKSVEGQVITESSEAATLIRSSLVRLGLPAPAVTEDMAKDELDYHMELARELAGLLYGGSGSSTAGLMGRGTVIKAGSQHYSSSSTGDSLSTGVISTAESDTRGLMPLDEVWCVWNRARGVSLLPPKTLKTVALLLPRVTSPAISMRVFHSGLCVLHSPHYSDEAFERRLLDALRRSSTSSGSGGEDTQTPSWGQGLTSIDVAKMEDAPILLVTEMIEWLEQRNGSIVRDEGGAEGVPRWYPNAIWPGMAA